LQCVEVTASACKQCALRWAANKAERIDVSMRLIELLPANQKLLRLIELLPSHAEAVAEHKV
jgi:pantothenate kinase-related protein Tda10